VLASTSVEDRGWLAMDLVDGVHESTEQSRGWSSVPGLDLHPWVGLEFPQPRRVRQVTLYPATTGFPVALTIQIWDGSKWVERATAHADAMPSGPQTYSWPAADLTRRIRVVGTQLRGAPVGAFYAMQLAELEVGE
jgi:hypothetical protein